MAMEKFHYPLAKGEIVLPKFSQIPFGIMRKMRNVADEDAVFVLFEELKDEKVLALVDKLTVDEVGELVEKWQADAQVSLGESEAS